jgi:hypothetical protein
VTAMETNVPDLLQRFATAPHRAQVVIGTIEIAVQSNDPDVIAAIQRACISGGSERYSTFLAMKVIRDRSAPHDGSNLTVLSVGPLTTLLVGTGSVLTLDCERCEILGFLAPPVSADRFVNELLPLLLDRWQRSESPPLASE